ncbi:putative bifunctional diguanylate cyclase/phosphodiesterase [Cellulosilyticum sp. I15G10I2]|uniref:putative bifunctional diguanylate cyclase/phosphodiesterase n=1 Tax=Cellulosilyticum sp. I15G10I2 TaxID=1892843 RepID=UPI00085C3173|nr:GGDEF domain-containing phosphodiesterase [Cellulosilyticum sp. I15G10I2]
MLSLLENLKSYFSKHRKQDQDINYYLNPNYKIYPNFESMRIAIVYGVLGVLWILLSDELLSRIVTDLELYKRLALYKGWAYVVITMILIYLLVLERLTLLKRMLRKIYDNFEELSANNEELIALEEELRHQFDELEVNRNALSISEQRYKLAVEGADCGIWDWDVENHIYYFSQRWKTYLGYEADELDNTFKAWIDLIHPDEKKDALNRVRHYIRSKEDSYEDVYRMRCKDGSYRWILSKGKAIWNPKGRLIRVAGSHTDISEQKRVEERLNSLVYYDALTQLPNRLSFEEKVTKLITNKRRAHKKFALLYMDIDNFKNINDTLGHLAGDMLLKHIADILKEHIQKPDLAARLSGDEFAVIFENINDRQEVITKIYKLLKYLRTPWHLYNQQFFISFSIGIALYPEHGSDLPLLLKHADMAMYAVKKNMKDNYCFYLHEMEEQSLKHITMVNELRQAIDNEEFVLYYQPIMDLANGDLIAVEALIRWIHPIRGMISPMEFIPLAEETGLIYTIGKWVLKTALMQKKYWEDQGYPPVKMSINVSGKRVTQDELIDEIRQVLSETQIKSDEIQMEVTETAVMEDIKASTRILKQIKDMGIKIALDDFGAGYSSLTYLQKLPIDIVKLDRDFIKNISSQGQGNVIVESIIKLTHELDLEIVAEGIETNEQLEFLKINKCDYGQGYLFSRPIPKEKLEQLLSVKQI